MRRFAWVLVVVGLLSLNACASSKGSTAFKHPTTGDVTSCAWDGDQTWLEILCPPCYHAGVRPTGYSDCKEGLEAKGYVMGEATRR